MYDYGNDLGNEAPLEPEREFVGLDSDFLNNMQSVYKAN
jgi:hypothetical protein